MNLFLHDKLKKLKRSSLYEIIDKLHTAKADKNPMTHYMNEELDRETLYYLLRHPSLFISQSLYYDFVQKYFPSFVERHPSFTQALIQMYLANEYRRRSERQNQRMFELNFKRVSDDVNRNRRGKQLPDNLNITVELNNIIHDTAKKMTDEHKRQLNYQLNRIQKDLDKISKEGLVKKVNLQDNPEIQALRKKHREQIQRQNKRIEKNKENRVKWMTERLKDKPAKYKVWQQTPNPKTRHTRTDGQKVKIEEKFIVINDKTGDIDYVYYPGDWTCSPSNSANCLCDITFTNDPTGYKPHQQLKTQYQQQSEKIKQYNTEIHKYKHENPTDYKLIKQNNLINVLENEIKQKVGLNSTLDKNVNQQENTKDTTSDPKYQKIKTPQDVADYFNLEYIPKENKFLDPKSKTEIIFDEYYTKKAGSKLYIDNKNEGNCCYDLKEVMKIWHEADTLKKSSVDQLYFKYKKPKKGVLTGGEARRSNGKNIIEIYPDALAAEKNTSMNLRRVLYHEMNHTLDYTVGTKKGHPLKYGISEDPEFHKACINDLIHQSVNKYPNCNISQYGDDNGNAERWADLGSMIDCEKTNSTSAILIGTNDEIHDINTFKKRNPYAYEYALKKLKHLKKELLDE